ncbi:hypothetical protein [Holospora elegans]|uniref:hypothetical protein n=1 Tax=Holospora elegans TaxID=431043 RepID=UPI001392329E|nr:hypothetical protein [Holospora elegans]
MLRFLASSERLIIYDFNSKALRVVLYASFFNFNTCSSFKDLSKEKVGSGISLLGVLKREETTSCNDFL